MRDWRKFVQVQMAGLPLSPGTKADVVDELAGHLEEVYEGNRRQGMTEELAAQRAIGRSLIGMRCNAISAMQRRERSLCTTAYASFGSLAF